MAKPSGAGVRLREATAACPYISTSLSINGSAHSFQTSRSVVATDYATECTEMINEKTLRAHEPANSCRNRTKPW